MTAAVEAAVKEAMLAVQSLSRVAAAEAAAAKEEAGEGGSATGAAGMRLPH